MKKQPVVSLELQRTKQTEVFAQKHSPRVEQGSRESNSFEQVGLPTDSGALRGLGSEALVVADGGIYSTSHVTKRMSETEKDFMV